VPNSTANGQLQSQHITTTKYDNTGQNNKVKKQETKIINQLRLFKLQHDFQKISIDLQTNK
jgi:hypothetical protein